MLVDWVRGYPTRGHACSPAGHRRRFDAYPGLRREIHEDTDG